MTTAEISRALQGRRLSFQNEIRLHAQLEAAFTAAGFSFRREVRVTGGRLDFLFEDQTALEVKVKGSAKNAVSQVIKYLEIEEIPYVIILTTKAMILPLTSYTTRTGAVKEIGLVEAWRNAF